MSQYLYGASVQGIQSFIFQTNKLKDIIGASELVAQICTVAFAEQLGTTTERLATDENAIIMAAGNIRYIFKNEDDCQKVVLEFPKKIMEMAPGITISQAVVKIEEDYNECVANKLEERLKIQRNKSMATPYTRGFMGVYRNPQTGLPAIKQGLSKDTLDMASWKKREKAEDAHQKLCEKIFKNNFVTSKIPQNINHITGKNDWIAIIHADGNGLGAIVQQIGKNKNLYKAFSSELDNATTEAAHKAYETITSQIECSPYIPLRPIVLSGDDMTIIIRGDLAIPFAKEFIIEFEKQTKERFHKFQGTPEDKKILDNGLTVCAGIAFIKSSFPFYHGYNLAESLCQESKNDAKKWASEHDSSTIPSCLIFHKVQDSYTEDYRSIVERELTPQNTISLSHGPYYISAPTPDNRWTINTLEEQVNNMSNEDNATIKNGLRQWIDTLYKNPNQAKQRLNRLKEISKNNQKIIEKCTEESHRDKICYPTYDILSLNSIYFQETK